MGRWINNFGEEVVCPMCGEKFVVSFKNRAYCSSHCAIAAKRKARGEDMSGLKQALRRMKKEARPILSAEEVEPVSLSHLQKVKKKPERCSDVRWRIELRRRAMRESYTNPEMSDIGKMNPDFIK